MGFPKIPDPQEIADMTAKAMEPMFDKLDTLIELLQENNRLLAEGPPVQSEREVEHALLQQRGAGTGHAAAASP